MLEAIDIILICLGSVVSLFALLAVFLLLSVRRKSVQAKKAGSQGVASKGYYLEQSPSIGAALKNGTAPAVAPRPAADTVVRTEDAELTKAKPSPEVADLLALKVEELSEVRRSGRQEEVHRGAHSIKRTHRPCKIKLSPGTAKAAHAEAVQTEHAVGSFLTDLSRIRSADDTVFFEEFQILEASDTVRERKCSAAEKSRALNRFVDILPNDDTRVILRGPKDYINASLIDGYRIAGQFIATQGPIGPEELSDGRKESTLDDFWRMIWEKNAQCVLMLTDCVENMRQRCSRYWPPLGEVHRFGELEVDLISESEDPICIHRELDITRDGEKRQVSQYHFLNWRDARGPESTANLLDFVERIMQKQYRKPIVVHCSAGVGRTGVLIALWRLLDRARHERTIDVFSTVDSLRRQRSRMVQTPEQYLSLYDAMSLAVVEDRV